MDCRRRHRSRVLRCLYDGFGVCRRSSRPRDVPRTQILARCSRTDCPASPATQPSRVGHGVCGNAGLCGPGFNLRRGRATSSATRKRPPGFYRRLSSTGSGAPVFRNPGAPRPCTPPARAAFPGNFAGIGPAARCNCRTRPSGRHRLSVTPRDGVTRGGTPRLLVLDATVRICDFVISIPNIRFRPLQTTVRWRRHL